MATPYVDLATIHNPATGLVIPSAWGDQIREDFEALVDPPAVSCFNSVGQNCATATNVILTADSENYDNDGMHSTVSQTSRITIQKAGRYEVRATVLGPVANTFAGSKRLLVDFLVNGVTVYFGDARLLGDPVTVRCSPTRNIVFAAADYVEVRVNQNSGITAAVTLDEFAATRITR